MKAADAVSTCSVAAAEGNVLTFSPLLRHGRWTEPNWCFCQTTGL